MSYSFGADVGGMTIKLGLFDEAGKLLDKWSIPTRTENNGAFIYDDIADGVKQKLSQYKIDLADVLGIGIDLPGPIYADGKLGRAPNISMCDSYAEKELSERLGKITVCVANDANCAAFGEYWMGAGRGYNSICMVTLGTGVGGGIIEKGRIIAGVRGAGGEIGHIKVESNEKESCNCGGFGCCEFYASATGIVRVAKRIVANGDPLMPVIPNQKLMFADSSLARFGEKLTAKDVCDLAKNGDILAMRVLEFSMDKLGLALANVTYTVDPELFIIGGGVAAAGDFINEMIRKSIVKYSTLIRETDRIVVSAKLGNDAGIYGCAGLVMKELQDD